MSAETTTPPAAPVLPVLPSVAVVNALLKWSEADRKHLAWLLLDSIREGFTSLEEAAQQEKDMIRKRLDDVVSGKVQLHDAWESLAAIEKRFLERHPQ